MDLLEFHGHLQAHFSRLSSEREPEDFCVHAIEHGLSEAQITKIIELLDVDLRTKKRADQRYWLPWIVAAAEVGYQYDGVEYWDSFAEFFPSWRKYGNRNLIRTWFKRFANTFRGHQPSGKWAEHFPIIAWPITHAVLPKYLQFLFVDHLFDLRGALSQRGEMALDEIGELLLDRYYGNSSRFIGLLQQTALTSRVVLAMQMEAVSEITPPIEQNLLQRIVEDVERRGRSGSRLRETRRVLKQTRFVNSAKRHDSISKEYGTRTVELGVQIRPRIIARQIDSENWQPSIVFPNLAEPLKKIGLSPSDFARSRMRYRIGGSEGSWSPGRGLFAFDGRFELEIKQWPESGRILELESAPVDVRTALEHHTILPAQFPILMRIKADGSATEVLGKHVKPGNSYLLLDQDPRRLEKLDDLNPTEVSVDIKDTFCVQIDVPRKLNEQTISILAKKGLGYFVSARIETVGLTPRWDQITGALVFAENETPLLRIYSDISVQEYLVTVDRENSTRFMVAENSDIIIALRDLSEGHHTVSVAAINTAAGHDLVAEEIDIIIRSSRPWQQSIRGKAGMSLWTEPPDCEINELLEKSASLRVRVPNGRPVQAIMQYYSPDEKIIREQIIGQFTSPATPNQLDGIVHKLGSEQFIEDYEKASRVDLKFASGELGSAILSFEKSIEPIRWIWKGRDSVRLSDDTDGETQTRVEYYPLGSVDQATPIAYEDALNGISPSGSGGLYCAVGQGKRYSILITCTARTLSNFQSLSVPVQLSGHPKQPIELLNALKHWTNAQRLVGPMAFMAKRNATRSLRRSLEAALCGADWSEKVNQYREESCQIGDLYTAVNHSRGYASGLRHFHWNYEEDLFLAEQEFYRLSKVYRICSDPNLCRLALRLAFAPHTVRKGDLPDKSAIKLLQEKRRSLIRGAYYAFLASQNPGQEKSNTEAA